MIHYVARRLGAGVLLVITASFVVYLLMLVNSAHIAQTLLGPDATPDLVARKSVELGLDKPGIVQYWNWLSHAVRGDLGNSWNDGESVGFLILNRIPVTLSIAIGTIVVSVAVSLVIGMAAGVRRGVLDRIVQVISVGGLVFPGFWLALVLVVFIAINLGILPATGYTPFTQDPAGWFLSLVLPVFSLALGAVAGLSQQIRSATIATLEKDYIRTLRSRGLPEWIVLLRHVLRNAAPPTLTIVSLNFIGLMSGAVMIEQIFALPGIGSLAVTSTTSGDIPVVMGTVIIAVIIVVLVNIAVDLVNGWLNPKVRLS
ncbi:ABC transporter permease [Arthrobacter sp. BF1]|uniref:ABC transporter permease n=1 Tax=Arthrobacter sp. BF1 TaxID=2821145 RepID=UPI001C4E87E5|nr:ABC transporter permease [Arthrobacter sp. BF1]